MAAINPNNGMSKHISEVKAVPFSTPPEIPQTETNSSNAEGPSTTLIIENMGSSNPHVSFVGQDSFSDDILKASEFWNRVLSGKNYTPANPLDPNERMSFEEIQDNMRSERLSLFMDDPEFFQDLGDATSFYINGIKTTEEKAKIDHNILRLVIDDYIGKSQDTDTDCHTNDVRLFYNPTENIIIDTIEAHKNLLGFKTEIASSLATEVKAKLDIGKPVYLFAHSQGGAISQDAMRRVEQAYVSEGLNSNEIQQKMAKLKFVGFGAFIHPDRFPEGSEIKRVNDPEDNVPKMAEAIGSFPQELPSLSKPHFLKQVHEFSNSYHLGLGKTLIAGGKAVAGNVLQGFYGAKGYSISKQTQRELEQLRAQYESQDNNLSFMSSSTSTTSQETSSSLFEGLGMSFSHVLDDHATHQFEKGSGNWNGFNKGYLGNMLDPTHLDPRANFMLTSRIGTQGS